MLVELIGLIAVCIGVLGYSIDIDEVSTDLTTIRIFSIVFVALSLEFLIHAIIMNDPNLHPIIHAFMALTVSIGGYCGIRLMHGHIDRNDLKDMVVYVTLVWLLGKNIDQSDSPFVYYFLVILSLIIAVMTFYIFFKVRRMRAFFLVDKRLIKGGYFVVALIGISAMESNCLLPIVMSAIVEMYVLYVISKVAQPFMVRR